MGTARNFSNNGNAWHRYDALPLFKVLPIHVRIRINKPTVYVDTTVVSCLTSVPSRDTLVLS